MNIISEDLLSKMLKMGFTAYEAKTYLGLLKHNPATGYEISHEAHVPRSVIYSILRKLESKGVVISIHDKPRRYIPLSPKQLLSRLESDFSEKLTSLTKDILEFNNRADTEGFWNIRGYHSLMQTCVALINEAKESIYISGWRREIIGLKKPLLAAKKRGVDIVIFSFNKIEPELGQIFAYGINEKKLSTIWNRKLILVSDSTDLVMGPANMEEDEQAIWTQNRAVLTIATNYIILDITLYGQRIKKDVSKTVTKLMTEKGNNLDQMIEESIQNNKM
ncbi:MAG: TrmB family transcriptional regulator [Candidatus Marinimicrobia bacterium]|nr:TrmB family transcriptional regulator [Candidatus Neomarinimicrobiota bacterium]